MMETTYRGRRAVCLEDDTVRVTLSVEGGHLAGILDKRSGINPLWSPPWPSIEPSAYHRARHTEYGDNVESALLAGILGHNLCLDIFGGPSKEEYAAGIHVHGEANLITYACTGAAETLTMSGTLPLAQLRFERTLRLIGNGAVAIAETVANLAAFDRPIAWTQHVTLGPPFLEPGATQLRIPARHSMVIPDDFGPGMRYQPGAEFTWPMVPNKDGSATDLSVFPALVPSTAVTAHLVDTDVDRAWFLAWQPSSRLLLGYVWRRSDFPWISLWEENRARSNPPWNGQAVTRGVEFGVSPFAEGRRASVDRGRLFDTPTYRWLPALGSLRVEYLAFVAEAGAMPDAPPASLTL